MFIEITIKYVKKYIYVVVLSIVLVTGGRYIKWKIIVFALNVKNLKKNKMQFFSIQKLHSGRLKSGSRLCERLIQ